MTGNALDEILSDETPAMEETPQEQPSEESGQLRDENGRFAKAETPETQEQPQDDPAEATNEEVQANLETEDNTVPQQALHASRQREREAKQEAETLRNQLAQMQGQLNMLSQTMHRPQQQPEPPKELPNVWEEPDAYFRQTMAQTIDPLQQNIASRFEDFSKVVAIDKHGQEAVDQAYAAMQQALNGGDMNARSELNRIMQSSHPYGSLVGWHKQRETLSRVGSDPEAFFDTEFERRMAQDAEFAKKVAGMVSATARQNSRSAPQTQIPPSLNRLPAGGNQPQELDASDAGLFQHALR